MILYNVTVNVESSIIDEWLGWMKDQHIPEVMATGCFKQHKILKLMQEDPEAQGSTYAVQYFAENMQAIDHYMEQHAPMLRQIHVERYGSKCVSFRTLLEEV